MSIVGTRPEGMTLCRSNDNKILFTVIMEPITAEEEIRIDKSSKYFGSVRYERKDGVIINQKDIYMYGEINLDSDDDLDIIERFNLVDERGNWIYSNFDYDAGTVTSIDRKFKQYQTWNPIDWFAYCHCLIGKPERIIVYKSGKRRLKRDDIKDKL